ncbi:MAG TPA: flagellar hook-basal body complex protein [Verrucomicrobiae bacterium]|jgi:flagellar hook protein FlgE|nr:flagellar hook-basal body complex protein [Verrucomicrobiae bacterium]
MIGSLQTGVSGLQQFQQDLEVIGNNIANVNTTGYKSATMQFADTFSQTFGNIGAGGFVQVGTGVSTSSIDSEYTQGTINPTGNPTNLAVSGNGFFVVKDPSSGISFVTRDGGFKVDSNGFLTNSIGYRVQGYVGTAPFTSASTVGDLKIDSATAITALNDTTTPAPTLTTYNIDAAGQINGTLSDGTSGVIGQVVLQNFSNPQALIKQSNNLLTYNGSAGAGTPGAPNSTGLGMIQSGALETSNVDLAGQMAALITAQRAFEANAKIITTSDEVLQDLVNLKR